MTCVTCFRSTSKKADTCGQWCTCCINTSAAMAGRKQGIYSCAVPETGINPASWARFNEATPDWLSFFMFTTFTDRDGKMQLESLAQSGFDPLARTTRFMLTEEGHHMFVGRTGVERVVRRTCEVIKENNISGPDGYPHSQEPGCYRPADHAEEDKFPLFRHPGFIRAQKFPPTPPMRSMPA